MIVAATHRRNRRHSRPLRRPGRSNGAGRFAGHRSANAARRSHFARRRASPHRGLLDRRLRQRIICRYAAGGDDATVVLGDTEPTPPNVTPSADGHDYGDYGVVHTIALTLENPTAAPAAAYLYFAAARGSGARKFLDRRKLRRRWLRARSVAIPSDGVRTAAGADAHTVVQTMTDGGSFYPVRLGVTATAPQPTAPPITAPDGCFPKATGCPRTNER